MCVVERIARLKKALRAAVDDATYKARCLTKEGCDDDAEDKGPTSITSDSQFWLQADWFFYVLGPIRDTLRHADTRFSLACRV